MKTLHRLLLVWLPIMFVLPICCAKAQQAADEPRSTQTLLEDPQNTKHDPSLTTGHRTKGVKRGAVISIGKNIELDAEDTADAVIAIGGSVTIRGKVNDAVVAIAGDVDVEGEVWDTAVAVLGDVRVKKPATVYQDAVAVGGKVVLEEGARIGGDTQELDFGMIGLATPQWLKEWFIQCALKLRLLAPQVSWVWAVAGGFLLFYLLIALVFPRPVQACSEEFINRPATTLLMGILTLILLPIICFILVLTAIGAFFVPFILAAVVVAGILGKVALLQGLGIMVGRQFRLQILQTPLIALLVGSLLVALLYMIPVLGLISFGLTGVWSIGGAMLAGFGSFRRELPPRPPREKAQPPTGMAGEAGLSSGTEATYTTEPYQAHGETAVETAPPPITHVQETAVKANFWERMGAGFLDIVLVSILGGLVGGPPQGFLVALAYFAGMWTWKGTTIGGIVLGLKVIRQDQQPVTFAVALVRALAAAFSLVVLFLGFLWIIWDPEKQGWHDKIAGTIVLKEPRTTPLVCV
ncbi:MAG TPA: RDD family protein [Clostridia bacterium]|nr:RDD family protein [Clostridia bacterium]